MAKATHGLARRVHLDGDVPEADTVHAVHRSSARALPLALQGLDTPAFEDTLPDLRSLTADSTSPAQDTRWVVR